MSDNLDQRYLEFANGTKHVFAQFPRIAPLRYFIFRELLVQPQSIGLGEAVKRWLRPVVHRQRTSGPLLKGSILIWIEGAREIVRDTLMPVFLELKRRGEQARLVSYSGPNDLPEGTLCFQCPAARREPPWAQQAWIGLCEAEPTMGRRSLERSFLYACANIESFLQETTRLLEAMKPQLVVNASTQLMGGSGLFVSARLSGIQTVLLQHGLVQPFYTPMPADAMLTWGRSSSDTLVRLGIEAQRLSALGSPRHDAMGMSSNGTAKQALLRRLALDDKSVLVFLSNGNDLLRNGSAPLECARWLGLIAKRFKNRLHVIVRLHPNEDGTLYRDHHDLIVTKDRPELDTLLDGCDCVGSLCSTAMYEALLYGKPVWQFYADGWPELADNWKNGLAQRISSQHDLSDMVDRLLANGSQRQKDTGVVEGVFNNHGRATQAVADFLVSQLR